MLLTKECSLGSSRAEHRTVLRSHPVQTRLVKRCAAGDSRQQQQQQHAADDQRPSLLAPDQQQRLRTAVVAAAVCVAFASNVSAARASDNWIPRRHHRHIGERFTDTWADSIVEVEHATASRVRDLERQLDAEQKRAEAETARRREVEQQLKVARMQLKSARPSSADDVWLSIKVMGADITGPLVFLLLGLGAYLGYTRGSLTGKASAKGRWVYDRSLGGKKVWVPATGPGSVDGVLPEGLSDAAFDELAGKAASRAAAARQKQQQPYAPPDWWRAPMSFAADASTKEAAQVQASNILARIEQAKNRGEDYRLSDIASLRRTCQAGGGVTVATRTVGGRDAIYKAAVDAAVRSCTEPGVIDQSDLADSPPLEFVAGVAQDLQIPDERAISMATNWVAGHCRSRIVEAYTNAKKGDQVASGQCLFQLANLLTVLPIIEPGSAQVELIADELKGWADRDILQQLQEVVGQVLEPEQQKVVTGMFGL